jgi:hypothetical protein
MPQDCDPAIQTSVRSTGRVIRELLTPESRKITDSIDAPGCQSRIKTLANLVAVDSLLVGVHGLLGSDAS